MKLAALLDCLQAAATALQLAPPALAVDDALPTVARYSHATITIRSDADCGVVVHELHHHQQYKDAGGPARTAAEWWQRELDAKRIELQWRRR